jgi:hypothetical protein
MFTKDHAPIYAKKSRIETRRLWVRHSYRSYSCSLAPLLLNVDCAPTTHSVFLVFMEQKCDDVKLVERTRLCTAWVQILVICTTFRRVFCQQSLSCQNLPESPSGVSLSMILPYPLEFMHSDQTLLNVVLPFWLG